MAGLPPLFRQEKSDNCTLACLRMILAQHGTEVAEQTLEKQANKQPGGVAIQDLYNLARHHGLHPEIVQMDLQGIAAHLDEGVFPLVYLNRIHFEKKFPLARQAALRDAVVHVVVPVRVSPTFVTFNDPRFDRRRRMSRRRFEAAQADLGRWCVVCRPG